jgi:hypothetical protein
VPRPSPHLSGILSLGLVTLVAVETRAQSTTLEELRDELRDSARHSRYTAFVATVADLAVDGQLSGGKLRVDNEPDYKITTLSLPWRGDFLRSDAGHALHVEATLGYARATVDTDDLSGAGVPEFQTSISSTYETVGLDVGVGPSIRLPDGGQLEAMWHSSLVYARNETHFAGYDAALLDPLTRGILFNWDGIYSTYGGSLALRSKPSMFDDLRVRPLLRYDVRVTEGLAVDDPALDASDTIHWATIRVDVEGALPIEVNDKPIGWQTDVGYRYLFGDSNETLGFRDYWEVGFGLNMNIDPQLPLLDKLNFAGAIQFGDNVFGWSIGLTVSF